MAVLMVVMSATLAFSGFMIARLGFIQLSRPALHDDSWAFTWRENSNVTAWLFSQHNEHRMVFSRLSSIIETDVFGLPVASTALIQSGLLILLSSGLVLLICTQILTNRRNQVLSWLAGSMILVNPWQWQAFVWDIQTNWFFANVLVLLTTWILIKSIRPTGKPFKLPTFIVAASIPWMGIFNHGSGFALSAAACIACLWISGRLATIFTASTLLASFTYFKILHYHKPPGYPPIGFDFDFFSRLTLGGPWQGLSFIIVSLGIFVVWQSAIKCHIEEDSAVPMILAAIAIPGIFAILFSLTTTLSRSGASSNARDYAVIPYYVTHTLMLGLSVVLAASYLGERRAIALQSPEDRHDMPLILYPSLIVVMSTLFSFPQIVTHQSSLFRATWAKTGWERLAIEQRFRCYAAQANHPGLKCGSFWVNPEYFKGKASIKPIGWHKTLLNQFSREPR